MNPQSAYAFDLEGIDSHQLTMRPAPAFASAEEAGEMVELYWMSLLRDTDFAHYNTGLAVKAAADLSKLSDFRGPKEGGKVRVISSSTASPRPAVAYGFPSGLLRAVIQWLFFAP